jgi:hypothetical protein
MIARDDAQRSPLTQLTTTTYSNVAHVDRRSSGCRARTHEDHPDTRRDVTHRHAQDQQRLPDQLLLQMLHDRVVRLENTIRWRWAPADVAMWDNRATQHYAIADYGAMPRRVQRITIAGDIPLGVDGRASVIRRGDVMGFSPAYPPTSGQA